MRFVSISNFQIVLQFALFEVEDFCSRISNFDHDFICEQMQGDGHDYSTQILANELKVMIQLWHCLLLHLANHINKNKHYVYFRLVYGRQYSDLLKLLLLTQVIENVNTDN